MVSNSSATIFIQVPVSTVTLSPLQSAVVDGKRINITCLTNDCRPPANITWFEGNSEVTNQITSTIENRSTNLTRTISVLHYTGIGDSYGKEVYCRANNIEGEHVESNRYVINVTNSNSWSPIDLKVIPWTFRHVSRMEKKLKVIMTSTAWD